MIMKCDARGDYWRFKSIRNEELLDRIRENRTLGKKKHTLEHIEKWGIFWKVIKERGGGEWACFEYFL